MTRVAECNSAIQQIANLRYVAGKQMINIRIDNFFSNGPPILAIHTRDNPRRAPFRFRDLREHFHLLFLDSRPGEAMPHRRGARGSIGR